MIEAYCAAVRESELMCRTGRVRELTGLAIESTGPDASIGELCLIETRGNAAPILAEVVGLRHGGLTLMPYGPLDGIGAGCRVVAQGRCAEIAVGSELLGRVIDGFGRPLDQRSLGRLPDMGALRGVPINPLQRPRIDSVLETGVRAVDTLLTLGKGQRIGIFAGSGVGKSTLLGMVTRHVRADMNVIALIGERGREVREFIEEQLGPEGLRRSVVVVATSDQPALARLRAAYAAVTIAEYFRGLGRQVLLTMDSVTRFAMARREVGLAAGEPPTARGYTPSVFAEIPELCERCGTAPGGGAITALLTVLVEGDDMNEPVADCLRATLDGHIVLSRQIAHQGRYPAIDVLKSASRLMNELANARERELAEQAIQLLSVLERNRQLVDLGAYEAGTNPALDRALRCETALNSFLRQREGGTAREQALNELARVLETTA